ncbi:MAG: hydrogenase maturation protease [Verrucomicrobiales bacterium]|nr:hydrogenase maturation protease [Verrucomicrobiales bacterium]
MSKRKVLVLGLGNDIMRDDAVGLHVTRELRQRLPKSPGIEVRESLEMGLALLDHVAGFDELVIIDAVQTGRAQPGTVHVLDGAALGPARFVSPHLLGVGEMLALGRAIGLAMPQRVIIYGIEVDDPFTVDTQLTPQLQSALPRIVEQVMAGVLGLIAAHGHGATDPGGTGDAPTAASTAQPTN